MTRFSRLRAARNSIHNGLKAVVSGVKTRLSKENSYLKNTAYIVVIVTLIITAVQASLAKSALEVSRADLEARTRPYLCIESIRIGNRDDGWISTNLTVNNYGEITSTRIQFGEISLNGTKIAGTSQPDKDYPTRVYTTEDGVTITTGRPVTAPIYSGVPYNIILFPQKPTTIEVLTLGSVQESAIVEGSIIEIGLDYSWGDKQYEYVATAVMCEGEWKITLERGD